MFTRLAATNCGWNALNDYGVLAVICGLKFWKDVPRGFFTGKQWNLSLESPESAYAKVFDSFIHFCLSMSSNAYWRILCCSVSFIIISYNFYFEILRY